jgi:hypothetical protein
VKQGKIMTNPTLLSFLNGTHSFEEVVAFIDEQMELQGKPAIEGTIGDTDGRCYYRTSDGSKCAIGHLIPDEEYQRNKIRYDHLVKDRSAMDECFKDFNPSTLDSVSVRGYIELYHPTFTNDPTIHEKYQQLSGLQRIHDDTVSYLIEHPEKLNHFYKVFKYKLNTDNGTYPND